jgi:hypothetical protein
LDPPSHARNLHTGNPPQQSSSSGRDQSHELACGGCDESAPPPSKTPDGRAAVASEPDLPMSMLCIAASPCRARNCSAIRHYMPAPCRSLINACPASRSDADQLVPRAACASIHEGLEGQGLLPRSRRCRRAEPAAVVWFQCGDRRGTCRNDTQGASVLRSPHTLHIAHSFCALACPYPSCKGV